MDETAVVWRAGETSIRLVLLLDSPGSRPNHGSVETRVEVDSGVFQGAFRTYLEFDDLIRARDVLRQLHDHIGDTAEHSLYLGEREIEMTFRPTVLGTLTVEVEATPYPQLGPFLRFEIQADQSYLPAWIASVGAAIRAWPTSDGPDED